MHCKQGCFREEHIHDRTEYCPVFYLSINGGLGHLRIGEASPEVSTEPPVAPNWRGYGISKISMFKVSPLYRLSLAQ